jgi:cytochrome c peroxidase
VVTFSFAHVVGAAGPLVVGPETPYRNAAGNAYGVMRLQYFVSDLTLRRADGTTVRVDETHYVDVAEPSTLRYRLAQPVPVGQYVALDLVVGIPKERNVSGAFSSPPESLMEWPDQMGGGYHYMKLEGRFVDRDGQLASFKLHTGMLMGTDHSVPITLDGHTLGVGNDALEIEIVMDVAEWLQSPDVYDLNAYQPGMMGNAAAQDMAQRNGRDAFTIGYVGPLRDQAPTPYAIPLPSNVPLTMIVPADNPTTAEGVALGRRLYYDPRLDGVADRACASCHVQRASFTSRRAPGVPAHVNLGFSDVFLWAGRVEGTLEDVMRFEVEEFFRADLAALAADPVYPEMFARAFGPGPITTRYAAQALAQFQRTLVSFDSKFDRFQRGEEPLTEGESRGSALFFGETGDCFHCHGTVLFTDHRFHNIGLDAEPARGRADVTGDPADVGAFKTPTLRNVALTAPYMHDDRHETLAEVLDFYSEGLRDSPTVDPLMRNVARGGLGLTPEQKADLLAFLHTLTDHAFTENPAFASPFE